MMCIVLESGEKQKVTVVSGHIFSNPADVGADTSPPGEAFILGA